MAVNVKTDLAFNKIIHYRDKEERLFYVQDDPRWLKQQLIVFLQLSC